MSHHNDKNKLNQSSESISYQYPILLVNHFYTSLSEDPLLTRTLKRMSCHLSRKTLKPELDGLGHDFGHEFVSESVSEADSNTRFFWTSDADTDLSHDFGHGHGFGQGHVRKPRTQVRTRTTIGHACPPNSA